MSFDCFVWCVFVEKCEENPQLFSFKCDYYSVGMLCQCRTSGYQTCNQKLNENKVLRRNNDEKKEKIVNFDSDKSPLYVVREQTTYMLICVNKTKEKQQKKEKLFSYT